MPKLTMATAKFVGQTSQPENGGRLQYKVEGRDKDREGERERDRTGDDL